MQQSANKRVFSRRTFSIAALPCSAKSSPSAASAISESRLRDPSGRPPPGLPGLNCPACGFRTAATACLSRCTGTRWLRRCGSIPVCPPCMHAARWLRDVSSGASSCPCMENQSRARYCPSAAERKNDIHPIGAEELYQKTLTKIVIAASANTGTSAIANSVRNKGRYSIQRHIMAFQARSPRPDRPELAKVIRRLEPAVVKISDRSRSAAQRPPWPSRPTTFSGVGYFVSSIGRVASFIRARLDSSLFVVRHKLKLGDRFSPHSRDIFL